MRVDVSTENDVCTVVPHGRIDSATSVDFDDAIRKALEQSKNIVIDFAETEYISSSGLRVLLFANKELGHTGSLTVIRPNSNILEVFDMTGFTDLLEIDRGIGIDGKDIKVLFFDVDGTLLSHKTGHVPESTKQAIAEARKRGVKVVIATGRDIVELEKLPVTHEIEFDGFLTLNGNICLDQNKHMFAGNPIDSGEVEILVQIFEASRIPFVLINDHERYINFVDDVVIKTQEETHGTIPEIGTYQGEAIYQCLSFVDDGIRQKLEELLDHCSITSWNETGIDILAKTGGKAAGIQKFLDEEGLSRSQVMAFGDGENDLSMIKFAGIGVAMGNATDKLKVAADYVTTSVDEDGIAHALTHFGVIG
ncbi:MAG: Cof-type HAD-IIB family hydrolase [Atopobiaceae bacterium]|nr:Cof-type HAD-IIB family hydrolase [Atopobiaceae bacterium]